MSEDTKYNMGCIVIFFLIFIVALTLANLLNPTGDQCKDNTFECRNHQVELCLKSDQYTRAECIQLVGGGSR